MPKNKYQPPKYSKINVGKTIYLGAYGSPESRIAYTRFVAEYNAAKPSFLLKEETVEESSVTVKELALAFLDYAQEAFTATYGHVHYRHYRMAIRELLKLYGDSTPAKAMTVLSFLAAVEANLCCAGT
jgi:hypothetical protein